MSSPSRIPLPKKSTRVQVKRNKVLTSDENVTKVCSTKSQENLKSSCNKPTSSAKNTNVAKAIESSSKVVLQGKKHVKVGDRRGISEIKRSEKNLMDKVEKLEQEMRELRSKFGEMERLSEEKQEQYETLHHLADRLKEEKDRLLSENSRLCEVLEEENIDPVSGQTSRLSPSVEEEIASRRKLGAGEVTDIMTSLSKLDSVCESVAKCCNGMVVERHLLTG